MRYVYIQNGKIIEGPRGLPSSWENTSGFNLLSDEELLQRGWIPWRFIEVQSPGNDWAMTESKIEITATEVVETQQYRKKTQQELDAEANQKYEQNKINRAAAYREESDPLFFKSQRGEATREEWLAKVQEIKQRYP